MPDDRIVDYIDSQRQQGISDEEIRASLINVGWTTEDIDPILRRTTQGASAYRQNISQSNFFGDAIGVFLGKEENIRNVASKSLIHGIIIEVILALIGGILGGIAFASLSVALSGLANMYGPTTNSPSFGTIFLIFFIAFSIIIFIFSFIGYGIYHLLALLFGGKGSFTNTYNAMVYLGLGSMLFSLLLTVITVILMFAFLFLGGIGTLITYILEFAFLIWIIRVSVVIFKTVHSLSTLRAAMVVLIPVIVSVILALTFVIGLAGFGRMDTSSVLNERCVFPTLLTCQDYHITPNSITLKLVNGQNKTINIDGVSATGVAVSGSCSTNSPVQLSPGASDTITIPCTLDSSKIASKNKYYITVSYKTDTQYEHTIQGEIYGRSS